MAAVESRDVAGHSLLGVYKRESPTLMLIVR